MKKQLVRIPAFDYPKAQGEPAMGKSIHRNGKLFYSKLILYNGKKVKLARLITTTRNIFSPNEQAPLGNSVDQCRVSVHYFIKNERKKTKTI